MCSCAHCCVPQAKEMHEKLAASMRSRIHALELEIGELNESATPNREKIDELTREKDELTRNLRMTEANLSIISIVDGIDTLEMKLKTEGETRPGPSFGFTSASWSAFA